MKFDRRTQPRKNVMIEFDGNLIPFRLWCAGHGVSYTIMYQRIFVANWSVEKALTHPVKSPSHRRTRRYDPADNVLVKSAARREAYL